MWLGTLVLSGWDWTLLVVGAWLNNIGWGWTAGACTLCSCTYIRTCNMHVLSMCAGSGCVHLACNMRTSHNRALYCNPWPPAPPPRLVWLLFIVFTCLHLFANYRAASVVTMDTFNQNRLHLAMEGYLRHGEVLGPKAINSREPLLRGGPECVVGVQC